ncbi:hypothetical protein PSYMO_38333, partial [Pseudomonas amygdali pv. mori str. 301020]
LDPGEHEAEKRGNTDTRANNIIPNDYRINVARNV